MSTGLDTFIERLSDWQREQKFLRCEFALGRFVGVVWGVLRRVDRDAVEVASDDGRDRFAFNPTAALRFEARDEAIERRAGEDDLRMTIVAVLEEEDPERNRVIGYVVLSTSLNRDDRAVK